MIQRIQTIYLLLAAIFAAVPFFTPIARFYESAEKWITLSGMGYEAIGMDSPERVPYGIIVFGVLSVLLPLIAIFGYKNRKSQIKKVNLTLFVQFAWYVAYAAYSYSFFTRTETEFAFQVCAALPLLAIISAMMARKAIRRDEALVRAADRIR